MAIKNLRTLITPILKRFLHTRRRKRRLLAIGLILLLLLGPLTYLTLRHPEETGAAWFDDDWAYRKAVPVSKTVASQNDVYINFTGADDIDTSDTSRFQSDCGDLRFTKQNGQLLPYYIVSGCGTASTVVHVEFDTIPLADITVYYYYGNPTVANGDESSDFSTVATNYSIGTQGSEEKGPGPAGYWKFDEGYGSTVYDTTSNANHGAVGDTGADPPVVIATTRVAIPTSSVDQDITTSALNGKTPVAALFKISEASSDGTAADHNVLAFGAVTGASQRWTLGATTRHARPTTTRANSLGMTDQVIFKPAQGTAGIEAEADFVSFITNGIRINWSTAASTAYLMEATFFAGTDVNAHAGIWTSSTTVDTSTDVTAPGFEPDVVIVASLQRELDDTGNSAFFLSYGFAHNDGVGGITQRVMAMRVDDGDTSSDPLFQINTSYSSAELNGSGGILTAQELGSFDSQGFSATTRVANQASDQHGYLALDFGTLSSKVSSINAPTGNGDWAVTDPGFKPQFVMMGMTFHDTENSGAEDGRAGVFGASTFTADDEFSIAIADEDGAMATDTQSLSDNQAVNLPQDDGTTGFTATFVSMDSSGWKLNFSAADSTARKWFYLAVEEADALFPASWQTEDMCVTGKCLFFDADDDVGTVTNADSIDFDLGLNDGFTFQAWVRVNSDGEASQGEIFDKGSHLYMRVDSEGGDGLADLEVQVDLATTDPNVNIANGITLNRWHHVAVGYTDDGDDDISVYIDGILRDTGNGSGAPVGTDTSDLLIGGDASNNFHGFIDEVKVYDEERTADEIKTDFIKGTSSLHGTQAAFGIRTYYDLSDGLVGYWKMDESSWTVDCSTDTVLDSSGNSNDGDACPNSSGPDGGDIGKFGNGGDFDGSNDYLAMPVQALGGDTGSISTWFYKTATTTGNDKIISRSYGNSGLEIVDDGGQIVAVFRIDGTWCADYTNQISTDTWYHLVGTYDGATKRIYLNGELIEECAKTGNWGAEGAQWAVSSHHATDPGNYFDGTIDDLRLYNRALSPAEVSDLYNWAPGPVGYWPLDENTGASTVYDKSGNGYNGTMGGSMTVEDWVPGRFGPALDFDGTDDNIQLSYTESPGSNPITLEAWIKPDSAGSGAGDIIVQSNGSYYHSIVFYVDHTWDYVGLSRDHGGGTTGAWKTNDSSVNADEWNHVAVTYDASSNSNDPIIYINGVSQAFQLDTNPTGTPDSSTYDWYIGNDEENINEFDGVIDEVKIYKYIRTQSQIIEDMNAGHPAPGSPIGSPVAHWQMDEGYGTTAQDKTDNNNDLTLSSSSWTLSGKFDKAWNGTGALWLAQTDDADFDFGSNVSFSLSMWVKSDAAADPSATEVLMNKHVATNNPGYRLSFNTSGQLVCEIDDDTTSFPEDTASSTTDFYDANWHHVVCIRDITGDDLDLYVDGLFVDDDGNLDATGDMSNADNLSVGDEDESDDGDEFFGDIDEVKVYRFALTADQVKLDMNKGSSASFGDVANQDNEGFGGNSAYLYYNYDDNTGTGTDAVTDISGNNNHGDMNGSMTEDDWVPGYIGSGLDFDGSNDYLNTGIASSTFGNNLTFSAWFNSDDAGTIGDSWVSQRFILQRQTSSMRLTLGINNDRIAIAWYDGSLNTLEGTTTLSANTWYHGAVTYDGTTLRLYLNGVEENNVAESAMTAGGSGTVLIAGGPTTRFFDGVLDQTKIYDYTLTQAQIAYDFNRGGPVGYWKLDECEGTTANDSGSGGNNGTITIGSGGSEDTVGTCETASTAWGNGATGKRNASLDFDGTDDYITVTDPSGGELDFSGDFSLSAWFKSTGGLDTRQVIVEKGATGGNLEYTLRILESTNKVNFTVFNTSNGVYQQCNGDNVVSADSTWHHVVATISGTQCDLYIDGVNENTSSTPSGTRETDTSEPVTIGRRNSNTNYFVGQIDEVKIFNYTLTADQIKRDYNFGAQFFGPATGSP